MDGGRVKKFKVPVDQVLFVFGAVVAVALERFLTESPMVAAFRSNPGNGPWRRELFYWSSLTVLVSLSLRFLIGSAVQLDGTYVKQNLTSSPYLRFFKDLAFLVTFGVFLVRASMSSDVSEFARWLTWFFVVAIIWCLVYWIECRCIGAAAELRRWLPINTLQLAMTLLFWWLVKVNQNQPEPCLLAGLAVSYAIIFGFDVRNVIENQRA